MGDVAVTVTDDPQVFLTRTLGLRAAEPVRTNVMGAVATGIRDEGTSYDVLSFFVVEDDGEVVGAAMWTSPFKLVVSPLADLHARAVGEACVRRATHVGVRPPGVVGPEGAAQVAAEAFGTPVRLERRERLLVLHDYLEPARVPGAARWATGDDTALVTAWLHDFADEAGTVVVADEDAVRARLPRTMLWEVDGEPVSLAGHAPLVETPAGHVARIGPVWTPSARRRHGWATAVTAALTEHLMPLAGTVMLYTDDANSTSNHVYESLGYVHEHDVVELAFEAVTSG